jgi:mRNA interferase HigB
MMRIFSYTTIRDFWGIHPDSKEALTYWYDVTEQAEWKHSMDVKLTFRSADILSSDRVVFDIKGNDYRLIASVNYQYQALFIKFVGTHSEYDRVNALTVDTSKGGSK